MIILFFELVFLLLAVLIFFVIVAAFISLSEKGVGCSIRRRSGEGGGSPQGEGSDGGELHDDCPEEWMFVHVGQRVDLGECIVKSYEPPDRFPLRI